MGVIDVCSALGWIEDCSIFGSLVTSESNVFNSMLMPMIVKEFGECLYTCTLDVDKMVLNDPS